MSITTINWYAANASRAYPFDTYASMKSDSGAYIPDEIISDLKIRFSGSDQETAYVSILYVTDVVSVIISITGDIPIAIFNVDIDKVKADKVYAFTSLDRDAIGHIVFGDLPQYNPITLIFSSEDQSKLSPMCQYSQLGNSYGHRWGIDGGRTDGVYPLYITSLGDVNFSQETLELDGINVSAIVATLGNTGEIIPIDGNNRNTLAIYAGKCGQRPESRTCDDPAPVETINGVGPDCCGRIFIEFRGCADVKPIVGACGVVLVCDSDVANACPTNQNLPDSNGEYPSESADNCNQDVTQSTSAQTTQPSNWWEFVN